MIRALVALLSLAFLPLPASAGTTGTVTGFTRDWNSIGLAHTRVTIASRGYRSSTTSDARGFFAFVGVPAGTYALYAEHRGYAPASLTSVVVAADSSQRAYPRLIKALVGGIRRIEPTVAQSELRLNSSLTIVAPQTFPLNDMQPVAQQLLLVPGVVGP